MAEHDYSKLTGGRLPWADDVRTTTSGGSGDGGHDDMERRVEVLEKGMDKVLAKLDALRDGQHAAALAAATQTGEINTKLATFGGKLDTLAETTVGLRRDIDKLPSKYEVAGIIAFVIGLLAATATLLKTVWPHIFGG